MDGTLECEVLEAGTHNGVTFTTDDLDAMVQNYDALKDSIKPPLKLGHEDAQLLAGQKDGDPALGWVSGLRRAGSKLIATVQNVPQRLVELIQKRRYRRVSSEVLLNIEKTGWEKNLKTGRTGKVLSAVALLGADVPAVASLADLNTWLASDPAEDAVHIDGPEVQLAAIAARSDVTPADKAAAVDQYGSVTYADPKNKKYPIDTEEHIRAAWNYINKQGNADKYGSGDVASIKARIVAAWKKHVDKAGPPAAMSADDVMLASEDANRCPACGATMKMAATGKRYCGTAGCKSSPPRNLSDDAATRRSEVSMPEDTNITALTAELETLKAKQAERDAKDAEQATAHAKLAAELETLKAKAADAERRAEQAAVMQRSLEADAFVERNSKQDCLRLMSAEARDRARALYVKLATSSEPVVTEAESITLKLTAADAPRTFTAVELLEAFVESLPDNKVLMTATAKPGKPEEPDSYEGLKATLAAKHNIDTTTAEGRAQLMRLTTEAVKQDPTKYGFRARG